MVAAGQTVLTPGSAAVLIRALDKRWARFYAQVCGALHVLGGR